MKKFWTSKSYSIIAFMNVAGTLVGLAFCIGAYCTTIAQAHRYDQLPALIISTIIIGAGTIMTLILSIEFTQIAYIDKNGVQIKNLVGRKILYRKWSEIKYITNDRYPISWKAGFDLGYYTLIDERKNLPEGNGLTTKKTYIKLPRNKKIEPLVKQYYQGEIKEKLIDDKK